MKILPIIFFFVFLQLVIAQERNDFEELASAYHNQGKIVQAAEYYSKSGYMYWNNGNKLKAIEVFQKAYEIFSKQSNEKASIVISNNLGLIYMDEGKINDAYTSFSNALNHARKTKNNIEIFNALLNTGNAALELSSYSEAIAKGMQAIDIAKEMNDLKLLRKCYSLLAGSYEKMGNTSEAYKYYEMYSAVDQKIKKVEMDEYKNMTSEEINKAQEKKRVAEIELKIKKGELKLTQDSLTVSEQLAHERQMQIELSNAQLRQKEVQLRYERHIKSTLIIGIIVVMLFLAILGFLLRQKLIDNTTLKRQKEEITTQRNKLDIQNKKITDSIFYGLRIQKAMLPDIAKLGNNFETFLIYRPKDIVSGDFYWFYQVEIKSVLNYFLAVIDCTGHGVPGAFMSMIGNRFLSEIIIEKKIYKPSEILFSIHEKLRHELKQENNITIDGMDIAICRIPVNEKKYDNLVFAGAKRPVLIYKANNDSIETIEGDNIIIGSPKTINKEDFIDKTSAIGSGDIIFMYTDGIIDQNNEKRNRFGTNKFLSIINDNKKEPMSKIDAAIEREFDIHKGGEEQRDDITVLGIRLK